MKSGKKIKQKDFNYAAKEWDELVGQKCAVCDGQGKITLLDTQCSFCNGTGEYSKTAESYMKTHICQCIFLDRITCPLCGKKCHHDTPNKPKVLIGPV